MQIRAYKSTKGTLIFNKKVFNNPNIEMIIFEWKVIFNFLSFVLFCIFQITLTLVIKKKTIIKQGDIGQVLEIFLDRKE